jgi:hypothetical protein
VNFDLTEDQSLLKAMVERWLGERYGQDLEARRRLRRAPGGFDPAGWQALADMGLLAMPFAEADCGLGGGPVEIIVAAEAFGRALAVEPFTECLAGGGTMLAAAAPEPRRAALLEPLLTGAAIVAPALTEPGGRYALAPRETRARRAGDGWLLSGAKTAVWQGMAATHLLVPAALEGDAGIGLFLLDVKAEGVSRRPWRAADGQLACELTLHEVAPGADVLLEGAPAMAAIEAGVARAWLAASAEMLGVATLLFEATLDYVKTRVQFGRPIGQFQVIQHRLTDAYVAVEQARSMVYRAALAPAGDERRAVAGAKAFVSEACRQVAHEAVQFHGGMGVTDELLVGHGLKRIQLLSRLWGDPDVAASTYAALARAA